MTELASVINVSWIRRMYRTTFYYVDGSVMKPYWNSLIRTVQNKHQSALPGPHSFFFSIQLISFQGTLQNVGELLWISLVAHSEKPTKPVYTLLQYTNTPAEISNENCKEKSCFENDQWEKVQICAFCELWKSMNWHCYCWEKSKHSAKKGHRWHFNFRLGNLRIMPGETYFSCTTYKVDHLCFETNFFEQIKWTFHFLFHCKINPQRITHKKSEKDKRKIIKDKKEENILNISTSTKSSYSALTLNNSHQNDCFPKQLLLPLCVYFLWNQYGWLYWFVLR